MTDQLLAWLCLKSAPGLKHRDALELLARYPDPLAFVGQAAHPLHSDRDINPAIREHLRSATPHPRLQQIAKLCEHYQIGAVFYCGEDYPLGLANILAPPLILWCRGQLETALKQVCLAVVGTRKPTAYGRASCTKLLGPVCQQGATIVSGLATGIDTVAHSAALKQGSKTIAVLASGLETIYPPNNRDLAEQITGQGALVSEYDPGTKLDPWNFVARNRIISALAQSVFIVEGSLKSGAMITAKHAIEQNRDVMALPGEISHPNAQGPNYLIKNGAQCVTSPEDILSALGLEAETKEQLEILPEISEDEQKLYDIFKSEQRELSFDELLLRTGHKFGKLSTLLLNLELKGYLAKTGGNSFILG
ncbi:MAG: DNA-processing protein DprA [Candidatus Cloacimonetes bacterium]|nr:DNA-processing protein DprA [Candidatus Cloacimonadota bacterium]